MAHEPHNSSNTPPNSVPLITGDLEVGKWHVAPTGEGGGGTEETGARSL